MAHLAHIWRHPIKGIGSEPLTSADLSPEGALTGDRAWAVLNAGARDSDDWQPRRNFLQVASGPGLATVTARTVGTRITLTCPGQPALHLDPVAAPDDLRAWVAPLWPADHPDPGRLVCAPGHGMTDMAQPYVSVGNLASLRALSNRSGQDMDMRRFRINLWLDGLEPWEERGWIGQVLRVGKTLLPVAEPIGRCRAPEANPATGERDVNVLELLQTGWGHTELGVYVRVGEAGTVTLGDTVALA